MKFAIAAVAAAFLITAVVYPRLPEQIPTHWNVDGEVDATAAKPWGAFLLPLMMLGSLALFLALPRISPKGYEVEERSRAYRAIFLTLIAFMFAIHLLVLAWSLGSRIAIPIAMPLLVGALFVILGNYLSKVPRNFFIGIRTPWTLADDRFDFAAAQRCERHRESVVEPPMEVTGRHEGSCKPPTGAVVRLPADHERDQDRSHRLDRDRHRRSRV